MKILIAYDASECADAAIFDLRRAGLPPVVDATVIAAADVWSLGVLPAEYPAAWVRQTNEIIEEVISGAVANAEKAAAALKYYFPGWRVNAIHRTGTPLETILAKADEWRPDLIVVGSHGRTALGGVLFGSVSQQILWESPFNVRVARGSMEENVSPPRLIVGVDGSLASGFAAEEVACRTWPRGTAVRLVVAEDARLRSAWLSPDSGVAQWIEQEDDGPLDWLNRMLGSYKARLEAAGLVVSTIIRHEDPQHVLLSEAAEWGADTVFVGARGLETAGHRPGRTAAAVCARARCSVEIVRREPAWAAQAKEARASKAAARS